MVKYHINPETGNPNQCKAKIACPFGSLENDHYASKEEARQAYESMNGSFTPTPRIYSLEELTEAQSLVNNEFNALKEKDQETPLTIDGYKALEHLRRSRAKVWRRSARNFNVDEAIVNLRKAENRLKRTFLSDYTKMVKDARLKLEKMRGQ